MAGLALTAQKMGHPLTPFLQTEFLLKLPKPPKVMLWVGVAQYAGTVIAVFMHHQDGLAPLRYFLLAHSVPGLPRRRLSKLVAVAGLAACLRG